MDKEFSHLDKNNNICMVDINAKDVVKRKARAKGAILLKEETIIKIKEASIKKGDVFTIAKIAAIQAAKNTSFTIPLCHQLLLEKVDVSFDVELDKITVFVDVSCTSKTGVEMEALHAVSCALLTIYDMCKAVDSTMKIVDIVLLEKVKE